MNSTGRITANRCSSSSMSAMSRSGPSSLNLSSLTLNEDADEMSGSSTSDSLSMGMLHHGWGSAETRKAYHDLRSLQGARRAGGRYPSSSSTKMSSSSSTPGLYEQDYSHPTHSGHAAAPATVDYRMMMADNVGMPMPTADGPPAPRIVEEDDWGYFVDTREERGGPCW